MSPNRWQFIDLSKDSAENLTQVKRHVMQEYMRQKRMETQQQEKANPSIIKHNEDQDQDQSGGKGSTKKRPKRSRVRATKSVKESKTSTSKLAVRTTAAPRAGEESDPRISSLSSSSSSSSSFSVSPTNNTQSHRAFDHSDFFSSHGPSATSSYPSTPYGRYLDTLNDSDDSSFDLRTNFRRTSPQSAQSVLLSSPRTVLSAARTDPFDTLPWKATKEDQRLFDFYVHEMPGLSYGHHYRTRRAHNWYTDIFVPEAMKGALTFVNTILVHAANTWAWVRNELETNSTLRYRQLAISMLRDHMQNYPYDTTDNVITACMSAAALEDFDPRPGHKEISWIHMRQAQNLIRRRGGPVAFRDTKLARLINWQDYILAGYVSDAGAFYFEDEKGYSWAARSSPIALSAIAVFPSPPNSASPATLDRTPSPTFHPFANTPEEEILVQCGHFLDFLARCEHLAVSQRMTLTSRDAPIRISAFQPGSTLGRILRSPAEKRRTLTGDRKQFIARLACLIMLNAALWDYRHSITSTEAFLENIVLQVRDSEVHVDASVEALLQILLACHDFPSVSEPSPFNPYPHLIPPSSRDTGDYSQYSDLATSPFDRPWFVGRMLKVGKRLGLRSWLQLNDFFLSCLTLQVQEHTVRLVEEDLRREILQAPLTSYVMPALQEAVFLGT